jgi:hypothetical protein
MPVRFWQLRPTSGSLVTDYSPLITGNGSFPCQENPATFVILLAIRDIVPRVEAVSFMSELPARTFKERMMTGKGIGEQRGVGEQGGNPFKKKGGIGEQGGKPKTKSAAKKKKK